LLGLSQESRRRTWRRPAITLPRGVVIFVII
jgi:hypothetical protein